MRSVNYALALPLLLANCGSRMGNANAPIASPSQVKAPDTSTQDSTVPSVKPDAASPEAATASTNRVVPASSSLLTPEPIDEALDCQKTDIFSAAHSRQKVFDTRYSLHAQSYSQVPTTLESPLETCGLAAALNALLTLQCDSGKPAFESRNAAHDSRRGSVGPGGRCGSIVDLYEISCPETNYEVHVDMYFCGP